MRLLILSCNTGEGHNSCAKAVQEYARLQDDICEITDSLGFISEKTSRFISNWHSRLYRHAPSVFDKGYKFAEKHADILAKDSAVYKLLTTGAEDLYAFIQSGGYDAVLCVHIFPALLLTRMLMLHPVAIRTGLLATDYTCSPGCNRCELDYCFIPDDAFIPEFLAAGVPQERIAVTGIPVRQAFLNRTDKCSAKQSYGIDPQHNHIVMACGSMGCGPMEQIASLLAEGMDSETELSIVCGTNRKLQSSLQKALADYPQIHVHGFVKDMAGMMDSADLFLTKPGGISVSEAAVKGLPMVLIDAVAGCESGNLQFFVEKGAAKTAETPQSIAKLCLELMHDQKQLVQMANAFGSLSQRNGAELIYQYMTK